jgi:hypothetical protein
MLKPLLPEPRRVERRPGSFRLRAGQPLVLAAGADDGDFAAARALRDAVAARCGLRLAIECHGRSADLGPRIELQRQGEDGEAYRLEIAPERVRLRGSGAAGLRYGAETLAQLTEAHGSWPACAIEDAPLLAKRGLMLDVSRGKDLCVRLKLNVLMLYTEHTFAFRRHPGIAAGSSAFSAEDLRELDAEAAARHVELVPCLQSLGHMERVLSLARYRELDESGRGWTLSPADPGSYALLRDLFDEYLPNFRSQLFNANCDEPWDLGRGRSRRRAESVGRGRLFLDHVRKVRDLARAHGKRTAIWGDVVHQHPEVVGEIDRDLLLLDWWYEAEGDFQRVRAFRDAGLDFWVCPGTSSWNCLFPRVANAELNITRWAEAARRFGAEGLLCTDWGDGGHYNLQGNSWLAFAWAAQQAWSGSGDPRRFDRAFGRALFGASGGEAARCYRELGAVHDVGFTVHNASPLQLLFFDDLDRAYFLQGTRATPLRRGLARLRRARARIEAAAEAFGGDELTRAELLHAADASVFALEKATAAREWLAWRRHPARSDARARRSLGRRLAALAREQAGLGRGLRRLWLKRSRPSEFQVTRRRLDASIRSLRRAARALERNAPPPAPEPPQGFDPGAVVRAVRASQAL